MRRYGWTISNLLEFAIDDVIVETKEDALNDTEYIASETIGEVIEKLIILHIRNWHIVDLLREANEEDALALHEKAQFCCQVKRPRLMAALNQMIYELAKGKLELAQDMNVKQYKGHNGA